MNFLWDKVTEWLKELLIGSIMSNLTGLFDNVNRQVTGIADNVGATPQAWNGGVFGMIRNLSDNVILPIADLVFPARHAIADPGELPALWRGKLTGGYNAGNYDWVTYPDEGEAYRDRGFVYTEGTSIWGFGTLMHVDASAPISPFGRANLTRIAEFCKKQNIRLVLVTAPLPSAYVQDTQNYQAYVDAMRSFAAANGTQYWDFSLFKDTDLLPIGFDDFSDMHHLNGQGAETFSKAFATVAARSAAGEDVSSLFYDTVAEKLATSPDSTVQQGEGN